MSVSTEIAQYMFRAAERPFCVDDPVVTEQYPQPGGESARLRKGQEMSVELECAGMKGGLESGDELTAEDTAEYFDGKEEGSAGGDPAGVIRSETAGGEHAVDMGMMLQSLVPGMEYAEEADLAHRGDEDRWRFPAELQHWRERVGCRSAVCSAARAERVPAAA